MKSYTLAVLVDGSWEPVEELQAVSRRQAMKILRKTDNRYSHTLVTEKGKDENEVMQYRFGGKFHGVSRVSLAT